MTIYLDVSLAGGYTPAKGVDRNENLRIGNFIVQYPVGLLGTFGSRIERGGKLSAAGRTVRRRNFGVRRKISTQSVRRRKSVGTRKLDSQHVQEGQMNSPPAAKN